MMNSFSLPCSIDCFCCKVIVCVSFELVTSAYMALLFTYLKQTDIALITEKFCRFLSSIAIDTHLTLDFHL